MSVMVDRQSLPADELGLRTVGQVLAHVQKENRLVVHVLIDGQEPDFNRMGEVRRMPLGNHVVFVETADPRELARSALDGVESQLAEADRLRTEASDLISKGMNQKAMEKLAGCFSTWQHAQESVLKTAQLLRLQLDRITVEGQPLTSMVREFAEQLRTIKSTLEDRDFVGLNDILTYETTQTSHRWQHAIAAMRTAIGN
jgi:hypothetical protein